jgi:hypothetical protein
MFDLSQRQDGVRIDRPIIDKQASMLLALSRMHGNLGVKWLGLGVRLGAVSLRILGLILLVLGFSDLLTHVIVPSFLFFFLRFLPQIPNSDAVEPISLSCKR